MWVIFFFYRILILSDSTVNIYRLSCNDVLATLYFVFISKKSLNDFRSFDHRKVWMKFARSLESWIKTSSSNAMTQQGQKLDNASIFACVFFPFQFQCWQNSLAMRNRKHFGLSNERKKISEHHLTKVEMHFYGISFVSLFFQFSSFSANQQIFCF